MRALAIILGTLGILLFFGGAFIGIAVQNPATLPGALLMLIVGGVLLVIASEIDNHVTL